MVPSCNVGRGSRGTWHRQEAWPPLRILSPNSYRYIGICMHERSTISTMDHQGTLSDLTSLPGSWDCWHVGLDLEPFKPETLSLFLTFPRCALTESLRCTPHVRRRIARLALKLECYFRHTRYFHISCHLMPEVSRLNGTNFELCTVLETFLQIQFIQQSFTKLFQLLRDPRSTGGFQSLGVFSFAG
jgi:hypothetical protein